MDLELGCILTVQELIEKSRNNLETCLLCADYEKASDKMIRTKQWAILTKKVFPKHLIKAIQSLYKNAK
jgi:hypothetical protein